MRNVINLCFAFLCVTSGAAQARSAGPTVSRPAINSVNPPPGSYELRCRGGALSLSYEKISDSHSRLVIGFSKGKTPATQNLNPGECAWMDRPLNNAEAGAICHDNVKNLLIQLTQSRDSGESLAGVMRSDEAPYIANLNDTNSVIRLWVQSNNAGCLLVKGVPSN